MTRITKKTMDFLELVHRQKKPEWLERHRKDYEDLLVEPLRHLATEVARELRAEAPGYRFPTRNFARLKRSADKAKEYGALYRDYVAFQASRDSGSRFEDLPNLYFHMALGHEEVLSAGGLYVPSSRQVKQIRAWIAQDASALDELLEDREFRSRYSALGDERQLKTKPRDYPLDHPRIHWLKLTAFYVWRPFSRKELYSTEFPSILAEDWRQVLRLNAVLDQYLGSWPQREALLGRKSLFEELPDIRAPLADWDD